MLVIVIVLLLFLLPPVSDRCGDDHQLDHEYDYDQEHDDRNVTAGVRRVRAGKPVNSTSTTTFPTSGLDLMEAFQPDISARFD